MSAIDLIILGIVSEKPVSAYEIQKDVEYHHYERWTKVSVPSIYRKVLQLKEQGYLTSERQKGIKFADKEVYAITEKGRDYFRRSMLDAASDPISLRFDFNVVISNLYQADSDTAAELIDRLRENIARSALETERYAEEYADIPLTGKTIFEQQRALYRTLADWLDGFELKLRSER